MSTDTRKLRAPETTTKRILVVDDDVSVRSLITKTLQTKGYEVEQAVDGLDASKRLRNTVRPPDLIICDVMMPLIDGFAFVRIVRSDAQLRSVPIVFLSAKSDPSSMVEGLSLGAIHYMQKPFRIAELLEKVGRALSG